MVRSSGGSGQLKLISTLDGMRGSMMNERMRKAASSMFVGSAEGLIRRWTSVSRRSYDVTARRLRSASRTRGPSAAGDRVEKTGATWFDDGGVTAVLR